MNKKGLIIYVYEKGGNKPVAGFFDEDDANIFIDAKEKKERKNYYTQNSDTDDDSKENK